MPFQYEPTFQIAPDRRTPYRLLTKDFVSTVSVAGAPHSMKVRTDSDIQDIGPTNTLLDVRQAPAAGWSSTHDAILRVGHTYVVWTWDDHYAKFRVTGLSSGRVVFDWAYQTAVSNPMLRPLAHGDGGRNVAQSGSMH